MGECIPSTRKVSLTIGFISKGSTDFYPGNQHVQKHEVRNIPVSIYFLAVRCYWSGCYQFGGLAP